MCVCEGVRDPCPSSARRLCRAVRLSGSDVAHLADSFQGLPEGLGKLYSLFYILAAARLVTSGVCV
jgi:hypothetical protein